MIAKFKVGDRVKLIDTGECTGTNTPDDYGYNHELGGLKYPYSVRIISVDLDRNPYNEPRYTIEHKHGYCMIYEPGLEYSPKEQSLELIELEDKIKEEIGLK